MLHGLSSMPKLTDTRDKKNKQKTKLSILRLNRGQGTLPRQQLTTGHTCGQGHSYPLPWANKESTEPSDWAVGAVPLCHPAGELSRGREALMTRCGVISQDTALCHISLSVWEMQTCAKGTAPHLAARTTSTTTQRCSKSAQPLTCQPPGTQEPLSAPYKRPCWGPGAQSSNEYVILRKNPGTGSPHQLERGRSKHISHGYISCLSVLDDCLSGTHTLLHTVS